MSQSKPETIEIIQGIQRGLADVEAGDVVSHEQAVAEIRAAIEAAVGLPGHEAATGIRRSCGLHRPHGDN